MERLENIWSNPDGDLPFRTHVDAHEVLAVVRAMHKEACIDSKLKDKVRQWMRYNQWLHEGEVDPSVYLELDRLLDVR